MRGHRLVVPARALHEEAVDVRGLLRLRLDGGDLVLDDGTAVRFDEAYSVDTLLFGLVFGGR